MWYWGAHALQHLGGVVIVGGDPKAVRRLGFRPASTLDDALEMAADVVGPRRDDHPLPRPPDPHGRRDMSVLARTIRPRPDQSRQNAAVAVPVPGADGAGRRRAAAGGPQDRSRLRHGVGPRVPGSHGSGRHRRGRHAAGHAAGGRPRRSTALDRLAALAGPAIFAANHHSHADTPLLLTTIPEPWRHRIFVGAAADYFFKTRADRRAQRAGHQRDPDRAHEGDAPLGRPRRRADRRRLEHAHLSRGRPQPRRVGPTVPGRRRVPVGPLRRPRRAGARRGHEPHPAQGGEAGDAHRHPGHVRRADAPRRRRGQPPLRSADRAVGRRRSPTRRPTTGTRHAAAPTPSASPSLSGPSGPSWRRAWALPVRAGARRRQQRRWPDLS